MDSIGPDGAKSGGRIAQCHQASPNHEAESMENLKEDTLRAKPHDMTHGWVVCC